MRITTSCEGKLHDAELTDEALRPCPFCGWTRVALKHTWTAAYWVECTRCLAQRPGPCADDSDPYDADEHARNAAAAVRAWNQRAFPR